MSDELNHTETDYNEPEQTPVVEETPEATPEATPVSGHPDLPGFRLERGAYRPVVRTVRF